MKRTILGLTALFSAVMLVMTACGGGGGGEKAPSGTGKAVFAITDAAADMGAVSSIQVTFDALRVHGSGGAWTDVSTKAQTFDLLALRNKGAAQVLAQADLKAGSYDQVELDVTKVVVVDTQGQHEAKLPSGKLMINGQVQVTANGTATATFDFLADQSLHLTGEGRYILAPVIKVEARQGAAAQVQSNNEVKISGGSVTTNAEVGMDTEGSMDAGLRVSPDAVLTLSASGKIVQTRGQALAVATLKSVDAASGTVTLQTKAGNTLVLHLAGDSDVRAKGSAASLAALSAKIGAEVMAKYNAETKALKVIVADADASTKADVGAKIEISGAIKAVDTAKGTVTVATDSGADVVLKVGPDSKVSIGGASVNLAGLAAQIGARLSADLNARTGAAGQVQAESERSVRITGTLKAVDTGAGTITLTLPSNADVTLKVISDSRLMANGGLSTMATLKGMIGSEVTVQHTQKTNAVVELNARGRAEQATTVTGTIKAVNPDKGTITLDVGGKDVTLNVGASSSVVADGTISSLAGLAAKIGAQVTADYDAKTNAASNVNTQARANAEVSGTLKAVDAAAGTITIAVAGGPDVVLNVAADSRVKVENGAGTLATLAARIGAPVSAEFNAETKAIANANVQAQPNIVVTGTLKSVDAAASTVTVTTQAGVDTTLQVTSDTKLLIAAAPSTLAALAARVGSQIAVEYNAQTKAAAALNAQAEVAGKTSVTGTLRSVNLLNGTITVAATGGQQVTLEVTPRTKVEGGGLGSGLVALSTKTGAQVTAEYNPQTNIAVQVLVQGSAGGAPAAAAPIAASGGAQTSGTATVSGTLRGVNVLARAVTITGQGGQELTLTVEPSSVVRVNGSASLFATLATRLGSKATVDYNAETRTVTTLDVQG